MGDVLAAIDSMTYTVCHASVGFYVVFAIVVCAIAAVRCAKHGSLDF